MHKPKNTVAIGSRSRPNPAISVEAVTQAQCQPVLLLLSEPDSAHFISLSVSSFRKVATERPDFPKPRWLGERGKRYVAHELEAWALAQTARPAEADRMSQRARIALEVRRANRAAAATESVAK